MDKHERHEGRYILVGKELNLYREAHFCAFDKNNGSLDMEIFYVLISNECCR